MNRIASSSSRLAGEASAHGMTPLQQDLDEPQPLPPPPLPPAPQEHGFIGGGFLLGATGSFINAALAVEGGLKLASAPLWIHGFLAKGSSFDFEGGGDLTRGLIGLETRGCSSHGVCGFIAVDVGYQTQVWNSLDEMTEHHSGMLIGPRAGLDAGGERVRFRFAFEVLRYDHHVDTLNGEANGWGTSGGFTMTLVYRL
jgi:hypothetical protein